MDELREHFEDLLESDQNDPQVQFEIGQCYREGRGVEKDARLAEKWLTRAAEQGHAEAKKLLKAGKAPKKKADGKVTEENLPRWCVRAEDGDPDAQYKVAMYLRVHGGSKGDIRRYLEEAAEQGHPGACLTLGQDLLKGTLAETARGVEYLRNAADCSEPKALELLADCYARGRGVSQDPAQAERYYLKAAERGDAKAKLDMAARYAMGDGVAESQAKAMAWAQKARNAGMKDAQKQLDDTVKRRKQEQERQRREAAEAQRKAAEAERKARQQAEERERLARQQAEQRERKTRQKAQAAEEKERAERERQRVWESEAGARRRDKFRGPLLVILTWLAAAFPIGFVLTLTKIPILRQALAEVFITPLLWRLRWESPIVVWLFWYGIFLCGSLAATSLQKRKTPFDSKLPLLPWFQKHGARLYTGIACVVGLLAGGTVWCAIVLSDSTKSLAQTIIVIIMALLPLVIVSVIVSFILTEPIILTLPKPNENEAGKK